ncbi:MAG TPA: alpha/beta fold hydrolase [Thermoanaerobaculia bacterium]|nr:alpha/beta fold hydrolase [Thermoanaerobaculia bacterium]
MLRASFGSVSFLLPGVSARCAERLFRTPARNPRLPREAQTLARGVFRREAFGKGFLATWTFGSGPPVLLVHGWGGHAGRLYRFVEALVAGGFSVITFDAPGHAESSGSESSLPDFAAAINYLATVHGPLAGIVGHSLGATASALVVRRGLRVPRIVLLAPGADPEQYTFRFAHYFRIPTNVHAGMKQRLAERYSVAWNDLRLDTPIGSAPAEMLVIHDRGDARVPWRDGKAIADAWPGAQLITTRGLGHHKILRDSGVVAAAVAFLAAPQARRRRRAAGPASRAIS